MLVVMPIAVTERTLFHRPLVAGIKHIFNRVGFIKAFCFTMTTNLITMGFFAFIFLVLQLILTMPAWLSILLPSGVDSLLFYGFFTCIVAIAIKPISYNLSCIFHTVPTPPSFAPAGAGSRLMAGIIDFVIVLSVFLIIFGVTISLVFEEGVLYSIANIGFYSQMIFLAVFLSTALIYNMVLEIFGGGQTLGKRIFGLRVISANGGNVGILQSLLRNFFKIIDLPLIGLLLMLLRKDCRRIGDILMETKVIFERKIN